MPTIVKSGDLPLKVQSVYRTLSATAANLNQASDELSKTISTFDGALKRLNLGVAAWVQISGNEDPSGNYWSRDLGYSRVDRKWGISLRSTSGNSNDPEGGEEEVWLFDEAPRWMRIAGIGKLPDLLDKLTQQAEDTTKRIREKNGEAKELADALKVVLDEQKNATRR